MGMGYVGITTALVFAEHGYHVTGLDPDADKIKILQDNSVPFYEPGVENLLKKHVSNKRILFSTKPELSIKKSQIIFLCVGTPSNQDGSANLKYIEQASRWIGTYMEKESCIVVKSTVPIGTHEYISRWISESQHFPIPFDVVSNPEFLREGSALMDSFHPDRIVIGSNNDHSTNLLSILYSKFDCPIIVTTPKTAQMIKYASNAFLAAKISFVNELARLCEQATINISDVAKGMGLDHRIGPHFLQAGIGYGGSCFPKDVDALLYTAKAYGVQLSLLEKVADINRTQALFFLNKLERQLNGFNDKTIAVLGISFKPNTDDTREAPSRRIISHLLQKNAYVKAHDPVAKLPSNLISERLKQCSQVEEALHQAHAVVLCTEWQMYTHADWKNWKSLMKDFYIFDGRNALDSNELISLGYHYTSIGKV
jgi:UDPglucose 6-dehydrogenase